MKEVVNSDVGLDDLTWNEIAVTCSTSDGECRVVNDSACEVNGIDHCVNNNITCKCYYDSLVLNALGTSHWY